MGLEQALTENEVILVDSSFKGANSSYNGHGGIGEYIFGINKFRAFDAGIIEKELQAMNEFLDILNLDCVRTTPETTTELQELETHISTKHHVLSQSLVRTPKNPRKKRHIELDEAGEYNQEIFGDLHNVIYRIVKASKKYELQKCDELCISQEAIDALKRVVCFISDLAQIKKPGSVDRDTDEKITASAFYFSMYSDKKPAVFTSDGDFYGLMSFVPRMMACRYFMPYNAEFRRAMKRNPPKLYLKRDLRFDEMERIEKSGVASDGDETELRNIKLNLTPEDGFKIGYLTKEGEMLEARRQVRELWEEFYNVQQEVTAAA